MSKDSLTISRQIIRTIPLVMRVVNGELRRSAPLQDFSQVGLMRVLAHKGQCKVSVLADLWSVSAPTMSRSIRRLEERGWVVLSRTPEDRRQVLVELTEAGHQVLAESYEYMARSVEQLVKTLPAEDQARLADGLDVLNRLFEGAVHAPQTLEEAQAIIQAVNKA